MILRVLLGVLVGYIIYKLLVDLLSRWWGQRARCTGSFATSMIRCRNRQINFSSSNSNPVLLSRQGRPNLLLVIILTMKKWG